MSEPTQPEPDSGTKSDSNEDIKAKMREALDRKHEHEQSGEAHLEGHAKASGVHGKSGGGRDFRRKAGPS